MEKEFTDKFGMGTNRAKIGNPLGLDIRATKERDEALILRWIPSRRFIHRLKSLLTPTYGVWNDC